MDKTELYGKRISIIGAGVSGRALALLASANGADVFVSDKKDALSKETFDIFYENNISFETGGHTEKAWNADLIILSSGVSPCSEAVTEASKLNIPVIGEIDFVYPYLNGRIIGVTGSNGKTTTTSLIGHILEACGYKTVVAGNIGHPAALYAGECYDFIVLELSSFQLFWSKCLRVDFAVITNLAPDHIDWHGSYENYVRSKSNLLQCRNPGAPAVIQARDMEQLNIGVDDNVIPLSWNNPSSTGISILIKDQEVFLRTRQELISLVTFQDIPLIGSHNVENVAMAFTVLSQLHTVHLTPGKLLEGFTPPPHRCELVAEIEGVAYIDDSKGTNVAASVTALTSIEGSKIVILGGQGKGEDYGPLVESVKENAIAAIVFGAEKQRIIAALQKVGFASIFDVNDMVEAVSLASRLAQPGTSILLSPACTSWDMYESYKKRGEHFQSLVRELIKDY